jgi:pterin-4a-carbinolamine dehydratase
MSTKQAVVPTVEAPEAPRCPSCYPSRRPALSRTPAGSRRVQERLKAERVQEKLRSMPGWKPVKGLKGSQAVDRVREFSDPLMAAAWAWFIFLAAAQQRQHVEIGVNGFHVTVRLYGQIGRRNGVALEDLDFAKQLG